MYIDIHSHVLPGIDDGARTIDESRAMLQRYSELGFGTVLATPHTYLDESASAARAADAIFPDVFEIGTTLGVNVVRSGEVRLTPTVHASDHVLSQMTLGRSKRVLVDFHSGSWPFYAEDALFQLQLLGYTPILAHPERYGWKPGDIETAAALVSRGVYLQVTLGSLVGAFGKSAAKTARSMLESELVHVLATDSHGIGARLDAAASAISWMKSNYEFEALDMLLAKNPAAILSDDQVLPVVCKKRTRRKFSFGFLNR